MKKYLLILIILFGAQAALLAQGLKKTRPVERHYTAGWNFGVPLFDISNYISAVSWSGAAVQAHFFVTTNVTLGASLGWNTYYRELGSVLYYPAPNLAVKAKQYRYVMAVPLKAKLNYFFYERVKNQPLKVFEPYIGIGVGGACMYTRVVVQNLPVFDFEKTLWGVLVSPEAGAYIHLDKRFAVHVAAEYNVGANEFTYGKSTVGNIVQAVFTAGLTYKIRK